MFLFLSAFDGDFKCLLHGVLLSGVCSSLPSALTQPDDACEDEAVSVSDMPDVCAMLEISESPKI